MISEELPLREIAQFIYPARFEETYYAMIGCFLDESFDPKEQGIFAVGGILGRGRPIFQLDCKWKALRERPDIAIEYFKASECQAGTGQFRKFVCDPKSITDAERAELDGIWKEFLTVMGGDYCEHSIIYGIAIIQEDFYEVVKDPNARAILGEDPYWFAYQAAMIEAAFAIKHIGGDYAAYICDEDQKHSPLAQKAYDDLKKKNPNSAKYMGSFTSMSDLMSGSLQAADAAIYEVRRVLHTTLGRWKQWNGDLRWQFRQLRDQKMMWLIKYAHKKDLEALVAENTPGKPLNLDHWLGQEFTEDVTY